MKFINIIGSTGWGKSTLARKLAQKRQLHYIQLDDWQESSNEALFSKLKTAMEDATAGWVLDGLLYP